MKKRLKKLIALLLCLTTTISTLPISAFATGTSNSKLYQPTEKAITIKSEAENPITILPKETEPPTPEEPDDPDDVDGMLDIKASSFEIERDYEQACMLTVTNLYNQTVEFYLNATNEYPDLSLEIIKSGSADDPLVLQPGESTEVEMSVFAQNAEHETYKIPVSAYVFNGDTYTKDAGISAVLNCNLPKLNLQWALLSEDTTTLRQKYRITNNGDIITDLVLSASGDLTDYLNFDPIVSNFELASGAAFEFTVQPDLAKMKANEKSLLTGSLVATGVGKTSSINCSFDTKGQEITVTTMGKLALQQDGNPFTKFEVVDDSTSFKFFNGKEFVPAENATLEDLLDEDQQFDIKFNADIDLGIGALMGHEMHMQSTIINDPNYTVETPYKVTTSEDGVIQVETNILLSEEEYAELISGTGSADLMRMALNAESFSAKAPSSVAKSGKSALISTTVKTTIDEVLDKLDKLGIDPDDLKDGEKGTLGIFYMIYQVLSSVESAVNIRDNPYMSNEDKLFYAILCIGDAVITVGTYIMGIGHPVARIVFGVLNFLYDWLSDQVKDLMLSDAYNQYVETHKNVEGHQCTNRGKVQADFYAPDFKPNSSGEKPEDPNDPILYVKSRMYGNGYVNTTDTNYDITLNGKYAGSSSTSGLTELVMEEISTDNLKPGEVNRLIFDYDTSPGSYAVSTDTEITLLYPNNTDIGYIGKPTELSDVRRKPDGAVYSENIFVEKSLIAGEAASLAFNVYNTGSKGGWFNISVTDGSSEIFSEKNYYLEAFSNKRFFVPWTPSEATNQITVSLTNTSAFSKERDSSNNTATKSLSVREREVPVIENTYTDTVYENSAFTVTADIRDHADVSGIEFYADGILLNGTVKSSSGGNIARYWLTVVDGLDAGEHQGTVKVKYRTATLADTVTYDFNFTVLEQKIPIPYAYSYSNDTLLYGDNYDFYVSNTEALIRTEISVDSDEFKVVEPDYTGSENHYSLDTSNWTAGDHTISIKMYYQSETAEDSVIDTLTVTTVSENDSYFRFTTDETIVNPSFTLFDAYGYSTSISIENLNSRIYRFKKTMDMYSNPANYTFFIQHDAGILVHSLENNQPVFSTSTCNTLDIIAGDDITVSYIAIEETNGFDHSNISVNTVEKLNFSPGQYDLYISGYNKNSYFSTSVSVNLTEGNQTLYVEDLFLSYNFKIEDPKYSWYGANVYYRNEGNTYWNGFSLDTDFDSESNLLTCFIASNYYRRCVETAAEVRIVVYSESEVYVVQTKTPVVAAVALVAAAKGNNDIITLSRDNLCEVSLVCEEDGLTVKNVDVSDNNFSVTLYANKIYLPVGEYSMTATVNTGNQTLFNNISASIISDCNVTVDSGLSEKLTDVEISWAEQYDELADVEAYVNSGNRIYSNQFSSGSKFKTETGSATMYVELSQGYNDFTFSKHFSELNNEGAQMNIGSELTSVIDDSFGSYDGGSYIDFRLGDIIDANGNMLSGWYVSSNQPLYGNIRFTDINDSKKVTTVPITTTSKWLSVCLPEEAGTYKMTVELYSYATEVDAEHTHEEIIDNAVSATCTVEGLTQGSHCKICGEVIVPQTIVSATGHNYSEAPVFSWAKDYLSCNAEFTCQTCDDTESVSCSIADEILAATCTANGKTTYVAMVEFAGKAYSDTKEETVKATGHNYVNGICKNCGEKDDIKTPKIVCLTPVLAITRIGKHPILPYKVIARYSDCSMHLVPVTWDKIDSEKYALEGNFVIEGTVPDTDIKAKCRVIVEEPLCSKCPVIKKMCDGIKTFISNLKKHCPCANAVVKNKSTDLISTYRNRISLMKLSKN